MTLVHFQALCQPMFGTNTGANMGLLCRIRTKGYVKAVPFSKNVVLRVGSDHFSPQGCSEQL